MTAAHYAGLSRIPLAIAAVFFALQESDSGARVAAAIVVIAGITDIADGRLARRFNTVSTFGAILDLTTDKVFVVPMLFVVARHDVALLWMAVIIAMRDLLIMGVRVHAAAEALVIPARQLGKLKSLVLYPALVFVILDLPGATWILALGTVMALVSGIDYLRAASPMLSQGLNPPRRGGASVRQPLP